MLRHFLFALTLLAAPASVNADVAKATAEFVGPGTYSPASGCRKLEDIENKKAEPNISTYPLTLTENGTPSWEGGCEFGVIRDAGNGAFESKMQCSEGQDEYQETVRFRRLDADRIEVASGTEALVYERCKGLKGTDDR